MTEREQNSGAEWRPARQLFTSLDRGYCAEADYYAPDRYSFWDDCSAKERFVISRGAGLSYAAASFRKSGAVVGHAQFNRLLDFDSKNAILEVEAGTTLGRIFEFGIQRGVYLAVQPGHPNITIGGCIAADVHGKNQFRDGTFLSCLESFRLFHPRHGTLDLSRDRNPDLFRLTCGGYGLTGNILSARLRLSRAPSSRISVKVLPLDNVTSLPSLLSELAEKVDLLYSWQNFHARGSHFGRGFIVTGTFDQDSTGDSSIGPSTLGAINSSLAQRLPVSLWNRWSIPVFNCVYHAISSRSGSRSVSMHEFLFPVAKKFSYFHWFGKRGFIECQLVIPEARFGCFIDGIRDYLSRRRVPISLASAKLFRGSRELLRFTGTGICLALDFPRTPDSLRFSSFLDGLMCECSAWPNLIKDSRLSAEIAARTYPEYAVFCRMLREFDPLRSYRSEMSERLGL